MIHGMVELGIILRDFKHKIELFGEVPYVVKVAAERSHQVDTLGPS